MRSLVLDRLNAARIAVKGALVPGSSALALVLCVLSPLAAQAPTGSDGIVFHAAGDAVVLQLTGRLQFDSRVFLDGGTGTTDAIFLRRAAPGVTGTFFGNYGFRFTADVSDGRPTPLEASVNARFGPALQLRAGKVLVPIGLGQLQGISNGSLAEHGVGSGLAPSRDVGVEARGTVARVLDYSLGMYNGVPDGVSGDFDWSGDKDLVGRAFLRPFAARPGHALRRLGFGGGTSVGRHEGTIDDPYLPAYRTPARERYFRYRGGTTPVVADGLHRRVSAQAYFYSGRYGVLGEQLFSSAEVSRGADAARLLNRSWQLIGSWVLTGEDASYTGVEPATRFDPHAGTWGAVEIAARVDGLRIDRDAFPTFSDPALSALAAHSFTGGVNWYANRNVRLLVNYELTRFDAAPGGERRRTERALASRFQLGL
jgi:phosphate-selective porin OprO and OprP